ncbi:MAG: hypothetical protein JRI36_05675, partial [Deltaproteobacteria bacterium]|nr:hypothetical protein [Deltaproteobacteria bacterium]
PESASAQGQDGVLQDDAVAVEAHFEQQVRKGWQERLRAIRAKRPDFTDADVKKYEQRLNRELDVIKKMGFPGYFLVVADFVRFAKEHHIPVGPGRGSAAGSLVAYALKITDLDPIAYGLIFERFLNPARKSMPDIDVDFCIQGRDAVFKYLVERYGGTDYVAQIITFGKMQARAVVRDVGRALDIPLREVDAIAKLIPDVANITLDSALAKEPKLKAMAQEDPRIKELLTVAKALEGLPRHASTHAAGAVISDRPMVEHLPLTKGKKGEVVTRCLPDHSSGRQRAPGPEQSGPDGQKDVRVAGLSADHWGLSTGELGDERSAQTHETRLL